MHHRENGRRRRRRGGSAPPVGIAGGGANAVEPDIPRPGRLPRRQSNLAQVATVKREGSGVSAGGTRRQRQHGSVQQQQQQQQHQQQPFESILPARSGSGLSNVPENVEPSSTVPVSTAAAAALEIKKLLNAFKKSQERQLKSIRRCQEDQFSLLSDILTKGIAAATGARIHEHLLSSSQRPLHKEAAGRRKSVTSEEEGVDDDENNWEDDDQEDEPEAEAEAEDRGWDSEQAVNGKYGGIHAAEGNAANTEAVIGDEENIVEAEDEEQGGEDTDAEDDEDEEEDEIDENPLPFKRQQIFDFFFSGDQKKKLKQAVGEELEGNEILLEQWHYCGEHGEEGYEEELLMLQNDGKLTDEECMKPDIGIRDFNLEGREIYWGKELGYDDAWERLAQDRFGRIENVTTATYERYLRNEQILSIDADEKITEAQQSSRAPKSEDDDDEGCVWGRVIHFSRPFLTTCALLLALSTKEEHSSLQTFFTFAMADDIARKDMDANDNEGLYVHFHFPMFLSTDDSPVYGEGGDRAFPFTPAPGPFSPDCDPDGTWVGKVMSSVRLQEHGKRGGRQPWTVLITHLHDSSIPEGNNPFEIFFEMIRNIYQDAVNVGEKLLRHVENQANMGYWTLYNKKTMQQLLIDDDTFSRSKMLFFCIEWTRHLHTTVADGVTLWEGFKMTYYHHVRSWCSSKAVRRRLDQIVEEIESEVQYYRQLQIKIAKKSEDFKSLRDGLYNATTVVESRTSAIQNENIRLLTYISFAFLPLSFVTSIFSMSVLPSSASLASFFVTAVVVTVVTLLMLFNMKNAEVQLGKVIGRFTRVLRGRMATKDEVWRERARGLAQGAKRHRYQEPSAVPSFWWYTAFLIQYLLYTHPKSEVFWICRGVKRTITTSSSKKKRKKRAIQNTTPEKKSEDTEPEVPEKSSIGHCVWVFISTILRILLFPLWIPILIISMSIAVIFAIIAGVWSHVRSSDEEEDYAADEDEEENYDTDEEEEENADDSNTNENGKEQADENPVADEAKTDLIIANNHSVSRKNSEFPEPTDVGNHTDSTTTAAAAAAAAGAGADSSEDSYDGKRPPRGIWRRVKDVFKEPKRKKKATTSYTNDEETSRPG